MDTNARENESAVSNFEFQGSNRIADVPPPDGHKKLACTSSGSTGRSGEERFRPCCLCRSNYSTVPDQ
ncbi:hypothetical protein RRG08_022578 [Elysia crispata]|uniref:Uncharacterized protein n=1 Tax=Elysia crispata TaxID=231223 RepID=A0AAE1D8H6_9GAST|nr:hypothetical protein RRG08_022578 [Elysia crispata]